MNPVERFWATVDKTETCWLWTGQLSVKGYGHFKLNRRTTRAHRFAYELFAGPIAPGHVLDHLCHNEAAARGECPGGVSCVHRACVNPAHLEPVTHLVNHLRSALTNAGKTHCCNGHEFTSDNTYVPTRNGRRECRTCKRLRQRSWHGRRAAGTTNGSES